MEAIRTVEKPKFCNLISVLTRGNPVAIEVDNRKAFMKKIDDRYNIMYSNMIKDFKKAHYIYIHYC